MGELEKAGVETYGVDVDFDSLIYCRERGFNFCCLIGDNPLPFPDNSFELVTMFDAIEHIEGDHKAMQEVAWILKLGGIIIISVPAYQFLYSKNDAIAQHYRRYHRTSINKLFGSAGLTVQRNTHSNVLLFPIILLSS
jgi:SAM-dependent methyltransferase